MRPLAFAFLCRAPLRSSGRATDRTRRDRRWSLGATTSAMAAVAAAGWLASLPAPVLAQQQTRPGNPPAVAGESLQRFNNNVVRLDARVPPEATSSQALGPMRTGTGVVLDERTVLTIGYLTLEADQVMVTTASGRRIPASVAGYDHATGFGVVRTVLPMDASPIALGDSDRISERERVLTLGHGEAEATEIVVLSRKVFAAGWEYLLEKPIFTFPPVNNWSGAALYTQDGKLVGIGSLIVNDAAAGQPGVPGNLYVPVNLLKPILADLLATGRRTADVPPWLGLTTESVRGNLMVTRVAPNGPADSAGVVAGDIVLGVGIDNVRDQAEFYRKVWGTGKAGVTVPLKVLKEGAVKEVRVKSIDRADFLTKATGI
jgi:serine protease Do